MSNRLDFEIEFKSDFHVGAGHGLGQQVDSALLPRPRWGAGAARHDAGRPAPR